MTAQAMYKTVLSALAFSSIISPPFPSLLFPFTCPSPSFFSPFSSPGSPSPSPPFPSFLSFFSCSFCFFLSSISFSSKASTFGQIYLSCNFNLMDIGVSGLVIISVNPFTLATSSSAARTSVDTSHFSASTLASRKSAWLNWICRGAAVKSLSAKRSSL